MNFMKESSMKRNLIVFCFGLLLSFDACASRKVDPGHQQFIDLEHGKNVNVLLMQGDKVLLQAKPGNQWSTLSAYSGEGGNRHNQAMHLIEDSQIAVGKIYRVTQMPFEFVEPYPFVYTAQVESGMQWDLSATYKSIKNKYLFHQNGWQSFEQANLPDVYTNHQYLDKHLLVAVVAAYKAGNCVQVSKEDEKMPWEE